VPDFDSDSPWPTRASWLSRTGALTRHSTSAAPLPPCGAAWAARA